MNNTVFEVSEAVALLNQTLEFAYPTISISGELLNFKIAKNKWVYADITDKESKLRLFGTVFQLPGPLEDGMMIEIVAEPRIHPQFGFSLNLRSIRPKGEGSIKKAADLLKIKLEKEGLFALERKRPIPEIPETIGVVASTQSAGLADFLKVLNARWQGVEIQLYDAQVQGEAGIESVISGINYFNQLSVIPEVLVIIRGGGSIDDLAVFSTEQVTRAVASSRIPTLVAIGHEVDVSLAELAADLRASTPSNAAELLFPDKKEKALLLNSNSKYLSENVNNFIQSKLEALNYSSKSLIYGFEKFIKNKEHDLDTALSRLEAIHPKATLKRGYSIVELDGKLVSSIKQIASGDKIDITLNDGKKSANIV